MSVRRYAYQVGVGPARYYKGLRMRRMFVTFTLLAGISLLVASCSASKSATPLSPSVAGPIAGVQISDPAVVSPADGSRIASDAQPITFKVSNAATSGVRPLSYSLE